MYWKWCGDLVERTAKIKIFDCKNEKILIAKMTAGTKGESKSADICKENILQAKPGWCDGHLVCSVNNFWCSSDLLLAGCEVWFGWAGSWSLWRLQSFEYNKVKNCLVCMFEEVMCDSWISPSDTSYGKVRVSRAKQLYLAFWPTVLISENVQIKLWGWQARLVGLAS